MEFEEIREDDILSVFHFDDFGRPNHFGWIKPLPEARGYYGFYFKSPMGPQRGYLGSYGWQYRSQYGAFRAFNKLHRRCSFQIGESTEYEQN